MNTITIIRAVEKELRCCLCCGKTFETYPYIVQDFCDRCYMVAVKEVFNKENGNLTCEEVKAKIKEKISEGRK